MIIRALADYFAARSGGISRQASLFLTFLHSFSWLRSQLTYTGPGSFLSICSPAGVKWVSERTGCSNFMSSATSLASLVVYSLKLQKSSRVERVPEPDRGTACKFVQSTSKTPVRSRGDHYLTLFQHFSRRVLILGLTLFTAPHLKLGCEAISRHQNRSILIQPGTH